MCSVHDKNLKECNCFCLGDLNMCGRIILKWVLERWGVN